MRVAVIITMTLFCFGLFDWPAEAMRPQDAVSQCCCKAGPCHCHHTKDFECPLKGKISSGTAPSLTPLSCGFGNHETGAPAPSKEFYLHAALDPAGSAAPETFLPWGSQESIPLLDKRLDKPPQNISLLFL